MIKFKKSTFYNLTGCYICLILQSPKRKINGWMSPINITQTSSRWGGRLSYNLVPKEGIEPSFPMGTRF